MVDLSNELWLSNRFGGSEKKKTLIYQNKMYMVKFPDSLRSSKKTSIKYINNQFSEYIGCHIAKCLSLPVQHTFLGKYINPLTHKSKIIVACEVLGQENQSNLIEFSKLLLNDTDDFSKKSTTIEDVMYVIQHDEYIKNKAETIAFFWDMFILDAFINNNDRHLDDWGFMENRKGELIPAPIYDCGSSLSPLLSDDEKENILNKLNQFKDYEYNIYSAYKWQNKKIFYHELFKDAPADLSKAILRIVPRIKKKLSDIFTMIEHTEGLSDISKKYMKFALKFRLEKMLLPALKKEERKQVVYRR